jgi:hypothetical protein
MAAKNTSAEAQENAVEEQVPGTNEVPKPRSQKSANVTSIKKNDEPEFYDGDNTDGAEPILNKIKRLARNKKVIVGTVTTLLLTTGVLVARNRNSVVEDETSEEQDAA